MGSKRTAEDRARYEAYLRSPAWRIRRNAVMIRAGGICEFEIPDESRPDRDWSTRCTATAVHCHHLTYKNIFNEPLEDLQALCAFHHLVAHVWAMKPRCECGEDLFDCIHCVIEYVGRFEGEDANLGTIECGFDDMRCRDCEYFDEVMDKDD